MAKNIYKKAMDFTADPELAKRKVAAEKKFAETNVYLRSKKDYVDVYRKLASTADQWRTAFMSTLGVLLVCIVLLIAVSMKSNRVVPYVVEVDKMGQVFPIASAKVSDIDNRIISSQIGQFIINSRTRVLDKAAELYFVKLSYRCVAAGSKAFQKLNQYYKENIPIEATEEIDVKIHSIISVSEKAYNVEWSEITLRDNNTKSEKRYKGYFEIVCAPSSDTKHVVSNPLGIYIDNFTISEMM